MRKLNISKIILIFSCLLSMSHTYADVNARWYQIERQDRTISEIVMLKSLVREITDRKLDNDTGLKVFLIIDNEIKVLTKADLEHSYFLGNVNDNKWRIRLVINAPIIGTKFIRLWDRGDFLIK